MKRMLINATQQEELRVAMVDGQYLYDLDIERTAKQRKKSNVYKSKITRIEPSLEAAFVSYGEERHGFLPFKEISRNYFKPEAKTEGRPSIKDVIEEGQEIIVQIDKEERGNKGAALTTFVSLAGRYLVMMPNNPRAGGVSRRIEGEERGQVREVLSDLDIPDGSGVIVRTAGVGRSSEELQSDLDYLKQVWSAIEGAARENKAPFLVYQDSNIIIRALRDNFRNDISEILIDAPEIYEEARDFIKQVMPHHLDKLQLYKEETPLFSRYQIESQIESAFRREVRLPSGGQIVIDHTEALTSIDINSGRATKGSDIEETALNTNLEASDEIARQLRLRDSGGLIVVDFIDMGANRNQRTVEERMRKALSADKARTRIGRISRFGLLEMSRQRLRSSLDESNYHTCPRCNGQGTIRSVESLALSILRLIEEEAMKESTSRVVAQVPISVATFLLNEKRRSITLLESRHNIEIILVPNVSLETPRYEITRERSDEAVQNDARSYKQAHDFSVAEDAPRSGEKAPPALEPAIKNIQPVAPVIHEQPEAEEESKEQAPGLIKRLFGSIFGDNKEEEQKPRRGRSGNRRGERRRSGSRSRRRSPAGRQQSGKRGSNPGSPQEAGQDSDSQKKENRDQQQKRRDSRNKSRNPKKTEHQKPEQAHSDQKPTKSPGGQAAAAESPNNTSDKKQRSQGRRRGQRRNSNEAAASNRSQGNGSSSQRENTNSGNRAGKPDADEAKQPVTAREKQADPVVTE